MPKLTITGAREHNLRGVDLKLTPGRWVAVVGVSGSGKTSLVFDTLVREGQRRYLGSLSPRARHYLGKLGRADATAIDGLPPAVAVGQRALTAHARSTVGTLTGCLDLLRLLFARQAVDPGGVALTRGHFSFNHPDGACAACSGLGVADRIDPDLLVADPTKSLRDGALRPTLKSGYTVYSQVTLDVMDRICRAHGFDVFTPWSSLTNSQRDVVLYGTKALKVPFGKHSIESRMRWEGITARPREEGYYRGLVPVLRETLARNRNANVLRFVRSVTCEACDGSRLERPGRQAFLAHFKMPTLLALPIVELAAAVQDIPDSPVWRALRPLLMARLDRIVRLGLGHLSLARTSTTLSGGEAQRVRLAAQLTAGLGGLLVALDEPTLGLHPQSQPGMRAVLDELRDLGNTLLVVEHDPDMVRYADDLVQLGPGAGPDGGTILYAGPIQEGPSPQHPLAGPPALKTLPRAAVSTLTLRGATLHNLADVRLDVQLGTFNVVTGPSGAGKSSLVFGTLLPALMGERGGPFTALYGVPPDLTVRAVDARPIGRTPRSTPATWSGLFDLVRKRFAATATARERRLGPGRFSYNTKGGRCTHCAGLGYQRIGLHLLEDIELPCSECGGGRYAPEVLDVTLRGRNIAQVLAMSVHQALAFFADDPPLAALCQAMYDLGLGYLALGQPSTTLSRGEAQRVKLATLVGKATAGPSLLVMDEPDRGLHPQDVDRLLHAIDALVDAGHTVLAISHHRHLWAAADHRVQLNDGVTVPPTDTPWAPLSKVGPRRQPAPRPAEIHLQGVSTHTLADLDVRIPHGKLTLIVGPSGSGKSSLAFATLVAESRARFSESLPFQVRRFIRRMPRPPIAAAHGLTPTLALRQAQTRAGRRSTVATQSEVGPLLRLMWSRAGTVEGRPCGLTAAHFSPDRALGACPTCQGVGTVSRCSPERLVSHPDQSLREGAMSGTRPGRFFGEPDGQYMATLQAVVGEGALGAPWCALAKNVQDVALYGAGDRVVSVTWRYQRGNRTGQHHFEGTWDGLCALVEREAAVRSKRKSAAEWAQPLVDVPCPDCAGGRLNPQARAVVVGGLQLVDVMAMPLAQVASAMSALELTAWQRPIVAAIDSELGPRVDDLCSLGLGHLSLDRRSSTLSDGELQRTQLAGVLRSGLTSMTVVLDEPSAGLHSRDVSALADRLHRLRDRGNTVVVVDHRPEMIRAADHIIEMGPGAGPAGGEIMCQGPAAVVLGGDSLTARALRTRPTLPTGHRGPRDLTIQGAHVNNLRDINLSLPISGFVAITGVSGSGKSSLVFGVLEASARAGTAVGCASVIGLKRFSEVRTPRSLTAAPVDAMRLLGPLQALFSNAAHGHNLPRRAFSFRSPAGRCTLCKGTGRERVSMDFLADLELECPRCNGRRYRDEVLAVRWQNLSIDTFLAMPVTALIPQLPPGKLLAGGQAMVRVGLGHLSLGRRAATLSSGEAQRLSLAQSLLHGTTPTLHLLDEPARGLHEADLNQLIKILRELAGRGDLVIATEHRTSLVSAADWVVELGPGGGPEGGSLVTEGTRARGAGKIPPTTDDSPTAD